MAIILKASDLECITAGFVSLEPVATPLYSSIDNFSVHCMGEALQLALELTEFYIYDSEEEKEEAKRIILDELNTFKSFTNVEYDTDSLLYGDRLFPVVDHDEYLAWLDDYYKHLGNMVLEWQDPSMLIAPPLKRDVADINFTLITKQLKRISVISDDAVMSAFGIAKGYFFKLRNEAKAKLV